MTRNGCRTLFTVSKMRFSHIRLNTERMGIGEEENTVIRFTADASVKAKSDAIQSNHLQFRIHY